MTTLIPTIPSKVFPANAQRRPSMEHLAAMWVCLIHPIQYQFERVDLCSFFSVFPLRLLTKTHGLAPFAFPEPCRCSPSFLMGPLLPHLPFPRKSNIQTRLDLLNRGSPHLPPLPCTHDYFNCESSEKVSGYLQHSVMELLCKIHQESSAGGCSALARCVGNCYWKGQIKSINLERPNQIEHHIIFQGMSHERGQLDPDWNQISTRIGI